MKLNVTQTQSFPGFRGFLCLEHTFIPGFDLRRNQSWSIALTNDQNALRSPSSGLECKGRAKS